MFNMKHFVFLFYIGNHGWDSRLDMHVLCDICAILVITVFLTTTASFAALPYNVSDECQVCRDDVRYYCEPVLVICAPCSDSCDESYLWMGDCRLFCPQVFSNITTTTRKPTTPTLPIPSRGPTNVTMAKVWTDDPLKIVALGFGVATCIVFILLVILIIYIWVKRQKRRTRGSLGIEESADGIELQECSQLGHQTGDTEPKVPAVWEMTISNHIYFQNIFSTGKAFDLKFVIFS